MREVTTNTATETVSSSVIVTIYPTPIPPDLLKANSLI